MKNLIYLITLSCFFTNLLQCGIFDSLKERNDQLNQAFMGTKFYDISPEEKKEFERGAQLTTEPREWGYFDYFSFQSPMTIQLDYFIIDEQLANCPQLLRNDLDNLVFATHNEIPFRHYLNFNTINCIMLTGPTGSGKTSLGLAIACKTGRNFIHLPAGALSKEYQHSPCTILNNLYLVASETKRGLIIIFDEVESLCNVTSADFDPVVVNQFCDLLDLSRKNPNLVTILIAENLTHVPESIRERFSGSSHQMTHLTRERRANILKHYFHDLASIDRNFIEKIISETEGFNFRQLNLFIKRSLNNVFSRNRTITSIADKKLSEADILQALKMLKSANIYPTQKVGPKQKSSLKKKFSKIAQPLAWGAIVAICGLRLYQIINQ